MSLNKYFTNYIDQFHLMQTMYCPLGMSYCSQTACFSWTDGHTPMDNCLTSFPFGV